MLGALSLLMAAIAVEVASTSVLSRTDGFRDLFWSSVVLLGYGVSIWLLTLVVKTMPVSTAYAIWSGLGTAAIAFIGAMWLGESWDWISAAALALIVVGVVVLNLHTAH